MLLIHGFLLDSSMFDRQVEALAGQYRFVTPDLRGHGHSSHRAVSYSQWDLMEDQVALLNHLGVRRAVWGGVSQGGFQSLRAALRHPERVAGLALIDTQAGPEDPVRSEMYEAFGQVVASDGMNEDIARSAALMIFGASASRELVEAWVSIWNAEPTVGIMERLHAVTQREDITDRLAAIVAPALVIHGEEDVAIEMERAQALASGLPNLVEFMTVPAAGHSSSMEQPGPVTAAIQRFLSSTAPR